MVYRIYTEDKNRDKILIETSARFIGFTVIPVLGSWAGVQEAGLIIEVISLAGENHDYNETVIKDLAEAIKILNSQEAVLITVSELKAELI